MRILLLDDRRPERDAMIRALPADTYRVEAVAEEQAALAAIAREAPQVVVFAVPPKGGPDLARRLRAADATGQAYFLAIVEAASAGKEMAHLVEAGVHDFIRRPLVESELLQRVKAPTRLLRWAKSVNKPAAFDFSVSLDVAQLNAFKNFGTLAAEDLGQIAGQAFCVAEGWPAYYEKEVRSATIPMSLAGDQLEVRVSVVVDSATMFWLREALLGDMEADDDAADDALRELANTAGGVIKRAALSENVVLTTGLPATDPVASFSGEHQCWSLKLADDRGCIVLVTEVRRRENQRVPASELTEGMVLAQDVRNDGGVLIVAAGARLSATSANKLAAMLGPRFFLEVAPAA